MLPPAPIFAGFVTGNCPHDSTTSSHDSMIAWWLYGRGPAEKDHCLCAACCAQLCYCPYWQAILTFSAAIEN